MPLRIGLAPKNRLRKIKGNIVRKWHARFAGKRLPAETDRMAGAHMNLDGSYILGAQFVLIDHCGKKLQRQMNVFAAGMRLESRVKDVPFFPQRRRQDFGRIMFDTHYRRISVASRGLITTLAVDAAGQSCYALEGSVFVAGAAVQWLRDGLGLIRHASETAAAAQAVPDNGGVYMVPAFVGLGAPHWDPEARGTLVGITRGSRREHIVRAALEAIAALPGFNETLAQRILSFLKGEGPGGET